MLLPISEAPPVPHLIQIVIEQPEQEPEPTLEEKIKQDINNCEPERYISAEDASCIEKPKTTTQTQKAVKTAVKSVSHAKPGSGWFPYGQCTYWIWSNRSVGFWNNATDWYWQAQRDGWSTGTTPRVGAIAWEYGHVALVTAVSGNNVTVSEMNYKGLGVVSTRTVPASKFKYIY